MLKRERFILSCSLAAIWSAGPCIAPGYAPYDTESLKWLPIAAGIITLLSITEVIVAVRSIADREPEMLQALMRKYIFVLPLAETVYWTISYLVTANDPKQMVIRQVFGVVASIFLLAATFAFIPRRVNDGSKWPILKGVNLIAPLLGISVAIDAALLLVRNDLKASVYYYAIDCSMFGVEMLLLATSIATASLTIANTKNRR